MWLPTCRSSYSSLLRSGTFQKILWTPIFTELLNPLSTCVQVKISNVQSNIECALWRAWANFGRDSSPKHRRQLKLISIVIFCFTLLCFKLSLGRVVGVTLSELTRLSERRFAAHFPVCPFLATETFSRIRRAADQSGSRLGCFSTNEFRCPVTSRPDYSLFFLKLLKKVLHFC